MLSLSIILLPLACITSSTSITSTARKESVVLSEENNRITAKASSTKQFLDYVIVGDRNGKVNQTNPNIKFFNDDSKKCLDDSTDPLACWLKTLKIHIPDESFHKSVFTMKIADLVCSNFELESISSSYIPSTFTNETNQQSSSTFHKESKSDPALSISLSGISASCTGKYEGVGSGGNVSILLTSASTISNTADDEPPFHIQMTIESSMYNNSSSGKQPIKVPHTTNVEVCTTHLMVPKENGISFSGSKSAWILELFASTIASRITHVISTIACPKLKELVDTTLTHKIRALDLKLEDLIDNTTFTEEHKNDHKEEDIFMSWSDDYLQIAKQMITNGNIFLSNHMNHGIILDIVNYFELLKYNPTLFNMNDDSTETENCGLFFRGVNGVVQKYVSHADDDSILITVPDTYNIHIIVPKVGNVTIHLNSINITGIDQLTNVTVFQPIDDETTSSRIQSDTGFTIATNISLVVNPDNNEGGFLQGSLKEQFLLVLDTSNESIIGANVNVQFLRNIFQTITMQDVVLLHNRDWWYCLLRAGLISVTLRDIMTLLHLQSVQIHHLNGRHIPSVLTTTVEDGQSLERDIDQLVNNCLTLVFTEYSTLVTETIRGVGQKPLRKLLNKLLEEWIQKEEQKRTKMCYNNDYESSVVTSLSLDKAFVGDDHHFYSFNESSVVKTINEFVSNSVMDVNDFISCASSFIQNKANGFFPFRWQFPQGAEVLLREFRIDNIGRFDTIDILEPNGRYHIGSELESGVCKNDTKTSQCSKTMSTLMVEVQIPDIEMKAVVNVSFAIGQLTSKLGTMILYDTKALNRLKVYEILERPWHLATPINQIGFYGFMSLFDELDLNLDLKYSHGGRNGDMAYSSKDPSQLGLDATKGLTALLLVFQDVLNAFCRGVFSHLPSLPKHSNVQGKEVEVVNETIRVFNLSLGMWYMIMAFTFVIANVIFFGIYYCQRDYKSQQYNSMRQNNPRTHETKLPSSLMFERCVSNMERIIIPIIAGGTILLFIVSSVSTGASVDLELNVTNSTDLSFPGIFTFSLGKTVNEMYNARVYTLMILVLGFSGIWPYVKMVLLLLSFITPERYLALQKRESLLIWLDALGKYSLVDSFVLVLMLVSFRFHFDIPGVGYFDTYVTPDFGFYSFLGATILSLTFGHGVTYLHRRAMLSKISTFSTDTQESISSHKFSVRNTNGEYVQFSSTFNAIWAGMTLCSLCLMVVGVTSQCFVFEFKGLAGLALGEKRLAKYSLIDLGISIPGSVKNPTAIGVRCIRWTYFFFALIMPFTCIGIVVLLYFVPFTLRAQRVVYSLAEICNAWSAIEVFLISIFASLLQLSQFAGFMVGDHCDLLKGFWGEDTCFDVQSSLGSGSISLCTGVILHCVIVFYSLRLCHHVLEERMMTGEGQDSFDNTAACHLPFIIDRCYFGKYLVTKYRNEEEIVQEEEQLREFRH